jgi:hypothetical protein
MSKKILIVFSAIIGIFLVAYLMISMGILNFETVGEDNETPMSVISVEDLQDGCYYIWHDDNKTDIQDDLKGTAEKTVFSLCPSGEINWTKNTYIDHTIWFTSSNDDDIPTFYPGDALLYISSTTVPYEGISWERFADYGYTIGVANMEDDLSGHYYIINSGEYGYSGYIYADSDANVLSQYQNVSNLFLDKIGSVKVRDNFISDGGTIFGLEKNKKYVCEWYTGTYYQDFEMKADVHAFGSMETFMTYDYEFLHSNCISIIMPTWLKTGYYYIDGLGFFRYLSSSSDAEKYNGKAYDSEIDWNDPIIIYDENGLIEYDPTSDYQAITEPAFEAEMDTKKTEMTINSEQITDEQEVEYTETKRDEEGDGGAENYEYIYNEVIIP